MNERSVTQELKLFMILLGSKAPGRNVEQHDYFFGIAGSIKALVPAMRTFWAEAGDSIHIDGWREVTYVNGFHIEVVLKTTAPVPPGKKLFFINLGGYQTGKLAEQHYIVLDVHDDRKQAIAQAKQTIFFKTNNSKGASTHIDEKYGIDVDDIYQVEDILFPEFKERYQLKITPANDMQEDAVRLGFFKLDKLQ